jgi:hypothetical protein
VLWTTTTILLACRRRVHGHHDTAKNTVLLPVISFVKKNQSFYFGNKGHSCSKNSKLNE